MIKEIKKSCINMPEELKKFLKMYLSYYGIALFVYVILQFLLTLTDRSANWVFDEAKLMTFMSVLTYFITPIIAVMGFINWKKKAVYLDVMNKLATVKINSKNIKEKFENLINEYTDENLHDAMFNSELSKNIKEIYRKKQEYPDDPYIQSRIIIGEQIIKDKEQRIAILKNKFKTIVEEFNEFNIIHESLNLMCDKKEKINEQIFRSLEQIKINLINNYRDKLNILLYDSFQQDFDVQDKAKDFERYYQTNIFSRNSHDHIKILCDFDEILIKLENDFLVFKDIYTNSPSPAPL